MTTKHKWYLRLTNIKVKFILNKYNFKNMGKIKPWNFKLGV